MIDGSGIAISLVVFEDGTFEGDSKKATQYLAKALGCESSHHRCCAGLKRLCRSTTPIFEQRLSNWSLSYG